ncbi:MAG: tetratricopeptide repeat protein [Saprospiraceae bacterium]
MKWIVLFSIICNVYVVYHHDITQSFLYNKNDGTSIKINTVTHSIPEKKPEEYSESKPNQANLKPKLQQTSIEVQHFPSTNNNSTNDLQSDMVRSDDNIESEYKIEVKIRTIDSSQMTNMEVSGFTPSIENEKLNAEVITLPTPAEGTNQSDDASVSIASIEELDKGAIKEDAEVITSTPTIGTSEVIQSEETSAANVSIKELDKGAIKKDVEVVTPTSSVSGTTQAGESSISDKTVNELENKVAVETYLENKVVSDAESQIKELSETKTDEDQKKNKQDEKSLIINRNFEIALQYNMNGNHTKAIPLYLNILEVDPNHKEANYNLALTKIELNDLKEGCKLLQKSYNLGIDQAKEMIDQHCRW